MEPADKSQMVHCFPEHVRKHVVEILKTGNVNEECLTNEDIIFYLEVSSMSPALKDACERKLLNSTGIFDCFEIVIMADKFKLLLLKKEALSQIVANFQHIWSADSFQYLNNTLLEDICQIDEVANHSDIFMALEKWLDCKHETRFKTYCKLLEIVQRQRTPHKLSCNTRSYTLYHVMFMMSSAKSKHTVVTAVFNCDGELVCHRNLFKSTDIKEDFSVACVQKNEKDAPYVYISSGKHVSKYDPVVNKHEHCDHLIHTRTGNSLVSLGDHLYCIGGHHNENNVNEIEELDTRHHRHKLLMKTSWKTVAKIPDNISLQSAPCVVYESKIFIIGETTNGSQVATSIVVFNPDEKSVQIVAEFPKQLSECKAVIHGTNIYIASSKGYFVKFDRESNIFVSCSDLPNKGRHFGIYGERNKIYTVGGTSDDNNIGGFEKNEYDIETDTWKRVRYLPCNLPIYGNCDIKVPSYTSVIPFYDTPCKEIKP